MPAYNLNPLPFKPVPTLLVAGKPEYLFGSFNDRTGPALGTVSTVAASGGVATVVFQILSGNVPVIGSLVSIVGTATSAGAFNVTNATVTSVAVVMATGVCTITFALAGSVSTTADYGQVSIPVPEVAETLSNGASIPIAIAFQNAQNNQGRGLTAIVSFPNQPANCTVTLQQAINDTNSEYADVATVATVTAGVLSGGQIVIEEVLGRFYRFNVTGLSESSPPVTLATIIGKILA